MRVIGSSGEQLGIMPTLEALKIASESGVDLVEIEDEGTATESQESQGK